VCFGALRKKNKMIARDGQSCGLWTSGSKKFKLTLADLYTLKSGFEHGSRRWIYPGERISVMAVTDSTYDVYDSKSCQYIPEPCDPNAAFIIHDDHEWKMSLSAEEISRLRRNIEDVLVGRTPEVRPDAIVETMDEDWEKGANKRRDDGLTKVFS
jgi:hypothetical protein